MTAQLSPEWFAARTGRVTGSRVGAILGHNPYQSRDDVLRIMVREALGAESEFTGNHFTRHGQAHEQDAVAALEMEHGVLVTPAPLVVHADFSFLAASPDGYTSDGGLIEAKCPQSIKALEEVPHYLDQMQLQMACTGRAFCWFVQWTESGHQIEKVEADPHWLDTHLPTLIQFMDDFSAIINDPEKAAPYLEDATQQRLDDEWMLDAIELSTVSAKIKELQQAEKVLKESLIQRANGRKCTGGGVTVYPTTRNSVDYKRALADAGVQDLEPYQKTSTSWTVRVN